MIDIAVVNNKIDGNGEFMALSEAGERVLLAAFGSDDIDNLNGDGTRYVLNVPQKARLSDALENTDLVVDGDVKNTYHYITEQDRVERQSEEEARYPFLVRVGSSIGRACVLRVGYVLSCDIALCHCTKSKGGICKSHNQRVFICINCDTVYAEDYVHSKLQFQAPIGCTS